jgi:vacuolar-type H+-ATPase subunit I/STV1
MEASAGSTAPSVSLEKMFQLHKEKQDQRREENELLARKVAEGVSSVASQMVDVVNGGVAEVFENQRRLESQAKLLDENAKRLNKQALQWTKLVEDFSNSLKELGDVENWAKKMEFEMRDVASSLEFIHKSHLTINTSGKA